MTAFPRAPIAPIALAVASAMACLLAGPPARAAGPFAGLDAIDRAVAGFTGVPAGMQGGATLPVDRRLRLDPCRSPLAISWRGDRHDAVLVQCPDPGSWHLYVPVMAAPTVASAPAVMRGEAISLVVAGDGFSVSQPGEAMESGAIGAWIRVRTVKDAGARGEPVRARIVRPGLAEVPVD